MKIKPLVKVAQRWVEANAFGPYSIAYERIYGVLGRRAQSHYLDAGVGVKPLRKLEISTVKTSNTVFILGSGASVNHYTGAEWGRIRSADSIGFNSWLIHDFVPTVYVAEPHLPPRDKTYYELLEQRAEAYVGVPFIIKPTFSTVLDVARIPAPLRGNVYAARIQALPGTTPADTEQAYRRFAAPYLSDRDVIAQKRSSADGLIYLAAKWGYEHIVLCGIDLSNTAYFYEEKADEYRRKGRSVPTTGQTGTTHRTMDHTVGHATADTAIYALSDTLLSDRGITLWTALSSSALSPRLPTYFDR